MKTGGAETGIVVRAVECLSPVQIDDLAELLVAAVADGASVGFLPPLAFAEARASWEGAIGPGVVLLVAEQARRIVGTVQLQCALRANGRHRAEVARSMVHPDAPRRGIGLRLMEALESEARRLGRTLLVLDTREGDPSNALYVTMGYVEAGRIPRYALLASGECGRHGHLLQRAVR